MDSFRAKQRQISCGDDYSNFYSLTLFDHISITISHRVLVLGFGGCDLGAWLVGCTYTPFIINLLINSFSVNQTSFS